MIWSATPAGGRGSRAGVEGRDQGSRERSWSAPAPRARPEPGSVADAEDALQDALLAAWRGLAGFEGRASVRTWLYRVTTTRCLNVRRSARRR